MRYSLLLFVILLSYTFSAHAQSRWKPRHRPEPIGPGEAFRRTADKYDASPIRLEFGLTGGYVQVGKIMRNGKEGDMFNSGGALLFTFDGYSNKDKHFAFVWGTRMGVDAIDVMAMPIMIGVGYNSGPTSDLGFRTSLMTGFQVQGMPGFAGQGNAISELNAGILINQRFSLGFKYIHPWYEISDESYSMSSYSHDNYNEYSYRYFMGEFKIRIGSRE